MNDQQFTFVVGFCALALIAIDAFFRIHPGGKKLRATKIAAKNKAE